MADPDFVPHDLERWQRASGGLGFILLALRVRIALWILLSAGVVAARAMSFGHWPRLVALAGAAFGVLLGGVMAWGLSRYLAHPLRGARLLAVVSLLVSLVALGIDLAALSGAASSIAPGVGPLGIVLFGELVAFFALAPLGFEHAAVASRLGATDVRRRALRSGSLVLLATAACTASIFGWTRLPDARIGIALAAASSLLVVLALAKVLGATRFVRALVHAIDAPVSSEAPLELSAWHRA